MKYYFFLLLLFSLSAKGQYQRHLKPLFSQTAGWTKSGWLGALGNTYSVVDAASPKNLVSPSNEPALVRSYPKAGLFAELGRFTMIPAGIVFHQMDYSLRYSQFSYHQDMVQPLSDPFVYYDKASVSSSQLGLAWTFNSLIQLGDYMWIQPSLGLHADFVFNAKVTSTFAPDLANYQSFENGVLAQGHAKLALGYKLTSELFIIPGVEVALWRLKDINNPKIALPYLNSKYVPLIFSLKFLLHRPLSFRPCDIEPDEPDLSKTKRSKKKVRLF